MKSQSQNASPKKHIQLLLTAIIVLSVGILLSVFSVAMRSPYSSSASLNIKAAEEYSEEDEETPRKVATNKRVRPVYHTCPNMTTACHPKEIIAGGCTHSRRGKSWSGQKYLVWKETDGESGLGNSLIFWPAVFAFSLFTGRVPLIDDISSPRFKMADICKGSGLIDCGGIGTLSETLKRLKIDRNFTESKEFTQRTYLITRRESLSKIFNETIESKDKFISLRGFNRYSNWWLHHSGLQQCLYRILECPEEMYVSSNYGRDLCTERAALGMLVRGPGRAFRDRASLSDRLVASDVDKAAVKTFMSGRTELEEEEQPLFDAALHFRLAFKGVERPKGLAGPREEIEDLREWLSRPVIPELLSYIAQKMADKLERSKHSRPGAHSSRQRIFISSDSEAVKSLLAEYLRHNYSVSYLPINPQHKRHSKEVPSPAFSSDNSESMTNALFEWFIISKCGNLFTYSNSFGSTVSTFSLTAALRGISLNHSSESIWRWDLNGEHFFMQNKKPTSMTIF